MSAGVGGTAPGSDARGGEAQADAGSGEKSKKGTPPDAPAHSNAGQAVLITQSDMENEGVNTE